MFKVTCIRTTALFVLIALIAAPASAKDGRAGDDMTFLDGLSLIVLGTNDMQSMHAARQMVAAHGGHIAIMSPPSVLIGWLPDGQVDVLRAQSGIAGIHSDEVSPAALAIRDEKQLSMVRFYNRAVSGEIRDEHQKFMETASQPEGGHAPDGDVFEAPALDKEAYLENLRNAGVDMAQAEADGRIITGPSAVMGNSDAMSGTSSVTIFFVESDGSSTDPDLYTWTSEHMQMYLDGVATATLFWSEQALFNGCSKTWLINYKSGRDPDCQQWTEPILHPSWWDNTWINEIMTNMGYISGGPFGKTAAFNTWQRTYYGTDRAFSVFVPYNPSPAPSSFIDGATAYAYLGGPYHITPFRVQGWTTSQVFAHETGHIYGNCDEYTGGCFDCGEPCGLVTPTVNGNCEACNPNSRQCMMRDNSFVLCTYSPGQLGWVANPCSPPPPPSMPAPTITSISPSSGLQGLTSQYTVTGTNFAPGMKVEIGGEVFVDIYVLQDAQTMIIDATPLNTAPLAIYDVKVINKDNKQATLAGAFEILPTSRHYYSPTGGNNFPFITPADAATDLATAIDASFGGDTLFIPGGPINSTTLLLDRGVLLHGAWDSSFTTRDLLNKTWIDLNVHITITPGSDGAGLDGFVLTGGTASPDVVPFSAEFGGAIVATGSSITLRHVEIHENTAGAGGNYGVGGGVFAYQCEVYINNCAIHDNDATQGGGMYLFECIGTIDNNTFSDNTTTFGANPARGAGVLLRDCPNLTLTDNFFVSNSSDPAVTVSDGGGLYVDNSTATISGGEFKTNTAKSSGGAIFCDGSSLTVDGASFDSNSTASLSGGAIAATNASNVTAHNSIFKSNSAPIGGALYVTGGTAFVNHNVFDSNNAAASGGAMNASALTAGSVIGNTLYGNTSGSSGGFSVSSADIEITNNIFANTAGTALALGGSPLPTNAYNLMSGNTSDYSGASPGAGAIAADPLFVNAAGGDFHLALNSPAIDAGDPDPADNDPDGSRGDMGAYGSHVFTMDQPSYPKNLVANVQAGDAILTWDANPEGDIANYAVYCDSVSGFIPSSSNFVTLVLAGTETVNLGAAADSAFYRISVVDNDGYASGYSDESGYANTPTGIGDPIALRTRLAQNRPNPFNPTTTIGYELNERSAVALNIYDVDGRLVRTLVNEAKGPGSYAVEWNGLNNRGTPVSSGIYFYRLRAGQFVETRKMVLLK